MEMKLVFEITNEEVYLEEIITSFRDEEFILQGFREPHKPSSTGRVYVRPVGTSESPSNTSEYYPSVFGLKFV
jgi:hypothetical protein